VEGVRVRVKEGSGDIWICDGERRNVQRLKAWGRKDALRQWHFHMAASTWPWMVEPGAERRTVEGVIGLWWYWWGCGVSNLRLGREREEEKREIRVATTLAGNTFNDEAFDYKRLWSNGRSTNEEEVPAMPDCVQL